MLKVSKKIVSSITAIAMVLSLSTELSLGAYDDSIEEEQQSVKLDYERVEELPDGGKNYVYIIDGVENSFPVPPKGFQPLTANDEQLETYGFPPRPDKEDQEEYENWVELMRHYKETSEPEIEMTVEVDEEAPILSRSDNNPYDRYEGGYYSVTTGSKYYTMTQCDFVYPTVTAREDLAACSFWTGIGYGDYGKVVCAGFTTNVRKSVQSNTAWYAYRKDKSPYKMTFSVSNFNVKAGDDVHIYLSYQKANNKLNYYFVNSTTGKTASAVVDNVYADDYFYGSRANWLVEQHRSATTGNIYLANFGTVTFRNCKAMLSNSTTWTDLNKLENLTRKSMIFPGTTDGLVYTDRNITNNTQFSVKWLASE